jgi:hypothetical protein
VCAHVLADWNEAIDGSSYVMRRRDGATAEITRRD